MKVLGAIKHERTCDPQPPPPVIIEEEPPNVEVPIIVVKKVGTSTNVAEATKYENLILQGAACVSVAILLFVMCILARVCMRHRMPHMKLSEQ